MDEIQKKRRLSIDEIMEAVTEIAQDAEAGADRFRALKMLASTESATVVLPEPMLESEMRLRLSRLMIGCGPRMTQLAYSDAWPNHKGGVPGQKSMPYADAAPELRNFAKRITSLPLLYKHFPESKRAGVPKGYPSGRSNAVKMAWCQDEALKLLVERETARRNAANEAMNEGTDAPPEELPGM